MCKVGRSTIVLSPTRYTEVYVLFRRNTMCMYTEVYVLIRRNTMCMYTEVYGYDLKEPVYKPWHGCQYNSFILLNSLWLLSCSNRMCKAGRSTIVLNVSVFRRSFFHPLSIRNIKHTGSCIQKITFIIICPHTVGNHSKFRTVFSEIGYFNLI